MYSTCKRVGHKYCSYFEYLCFNILAAGKYKHLQSKTTYISGLILEINPFLRYHSSKSFCTFALVVSVIINDTIHVEFHVLK